MIPLFYAINHLLVRWSGKVRLRESACWSRDSPFCITPLIHGLIPATRHFRNSRRRDFNDVILTSWWKPKQETVWDGKCSPNGFATTESVRRDGVKRGRKFIPSRISRFCYETAQTGTVLLNTMCRQIMGYNLYKNQWSGTWWQYAYLNLVVSPPMKFHWISSIGCRVIVQ